MTKRIYVGNIPWSASEEEVRELFGLFGPVQGFDWVADSLTGTFRGFAFVVMKDRDADRAIAGLNGIELSGWPLKVEEAHRS